MTRGNDAVLALVVKHLSGLVDSVAPGAEVQSRVKSLESALDKLRTEREVLDLFGVRVITQRVACCYRLLERFHAECVPLPRQFDDYIQRPKTNGYRALHTTVVAPIGCLVEIQLRTQAMHWHAEWGSASHRLYKPGICLW